MDITAINRLLSNRAPPRPPWLILPGRFNHQCQAHQEVIMSLRWVNIEVHRLAGTTLALSLLHLKPELVLLGSAIPSIHFQPAAVNGS